MNFYLLIPIMGNGKLRMTQFVRYLLNTSLFQMLFQFLMFRINVANSQSPTVSRTFWQMLFWWTYFLFLTTLKYRKEFISISTPWTAWTVKAKRIALHEQRDFKYWIHLYDIWRCIHTEHARLQNTFNGKENLTPKSSDIYHHLWLEVLAEERSGQTKKLVKRYLCCLLQSTVQCVLRTLPDCLNDLLNLTRVPPLLLFVTG
jgi:hypothetical protein